MVLYTAGLLIGLGALREVCAGETCHPNSLNPEQASFNQQLGLSLDFYAWYTTLVLGLFGFVFFAIAWLIFLRRSDDWMALFVSLWMVLFGAGINGVIPGPGTILFIFANAGLFLLMCLFPDGKFVPRWTRWLVPMPAKLMPPRTTYFWGAPSNRRDSCRFDQLDESFRGIGREVRDLQRG